MYDMMICTSNDREQGPGGPREMREHVTPLLELKNRGSMYHRAALEPI